MKPQFPRQFLERLAEMYPKNFEELAGQLRGKPVVMRLVAQMEPCVRGEIEAIGGSLAQIAGFDGVFEASGVSAEALTKLEAYRSGKCYIQSLASICIPMVLDPRPGERILDLCAAPGSKTSQMALMIREREEWSKGVGGFNQPIVAVELDKNRVKRLREVLKLQGVCDMVDVLCGSGTKLPESFDSFFDKVLVDAPCSADARFDPQKPRTFSHWAKHRIKGYALKQKKLMMSGFRYLKPGGILVYSTCSMNPEENEAIIDYVLRRLDGVEVLDVRLPIGRLEPVMEWHGKGYDPSVERTFRMKPDRLVQPFFVCKLIKV